MRQVGLLERDAELAAIGEALDRARDGEGGVVAIEAAAGLGKTALLAAAQERAASDRMQVLSARGFELESQFTFGVLRQLYEPQVRRAGPEERERLLSGAAALAAPAVGLAEPPATQSADPIFAVAHGVYWLTATLAARAPLLIAVDDVQWADAASLRCLAYLSPRLEELPALLMIACRPGEPRAPEELLAALSASEGAGRLSPAELSVAGTGTMIAERMGAEPEATFAAAAHELTGGNPFLVASLAADLRDEGVRPDTEAARRLPAVTPEAVRRSVLVRLSRLGEGARAIAEAVAVLGDGAALAQAAQLADLDKAGAADAADRLARADVLRDGRALVFTHPLVRAAVHAETPPHRRSALHAAAARLLHSADASIEQVGAQLMHTAPAGDPWAAARLAEAGDAADSRGDLESAVAFFERALEEPPPAADRGRLLHRLGNAEFRAGVAGSDDHLRRAADCAEDPALVAAIRFDQARAMLLSGRPEAVGMLKQVSAGPAGDDRGEIVRKECELIALGRFSPSTAPLVSGLADALEGVASRREPGWEDALGVLAGQAYLRNEPASRVADLARRSLEGRRERGDDPFDFALSINVCYALLVAGEYAEAERHLDHAIDGARRANAVIGFATAASFRADSAWRRGELARAEADATMALEAVRASFLQPPLPAVIATLVHVLVERGQLNDAHRLLAEHGFMGELPEYAAFPNLRYARGVLREAQGRAADALADVLAAGEAVVALGVRGPGPFPWRPTAAVLMARLGRREEAAAMAADGVALARAYGEPHALGIALRAAGLVQGGEPGLALLEESLDVLAGTPVALELARSRTDLGAALRRYGRRQAAREVLREALDAASRCGSLALAERARAELVTAGAKPRRERTSGIDALTASERRVAELAIDGLTNRQVAEALFVTISTVEKHLASSYSKLGIAGRAGLAEAFTPTRR